MILLTLRITRSENDEVFILTMKCHDDNVDNDERILYDAATVGVCVCVGCAVRLLFLCDFKTYRPNSNSFMIIAME